MHTPRLRNVSLAVAFLIAGLSGAAAACTPPERPFPPSSPEDMRIYADLIRVDFETYIADVQEYFRCLDAERARVFAEAQEVSEDYGRFLEAVE